MTDLDLFWEVFTTHGSLIVECVCGRTVFASGDPDADYNPGELESLRRHVECGALFIEDARNVMVSAATIYGQTIAFGCGCDCAQRYARLLVEDAPRIAEFLRKRYEQRRSAAERVLNALPPKGEA